MNEQRYTPDWSNSSIKWRTTTRNGALTTRGTTSYATGRTTRARTTRARTTRGRIARALTARTVTFAAAALLAAISAPSAHADTRVDLIPSVAYFNPMNTVVEEQGISAKFATAPALGGRLAIWFNESVAIEGTGHYLRSSLLADVFGQDGGAIDLSMFYGSAQVVVGLGAEKRFLVHGGLGVQGTNYDEFLEGGNILSAVLGISGSMPLTSKVAFRTDVDSYLHTSWFEVDGTRSTERSQIDMLVSVGLQFTPGGR